MHVVDWVFFDMVYSHQWSRKRPLWRYNEDLNEYKHTHWFKIGRKQVGNLFAIGNFSLQQNSMFLLLCRKLAAEYFRHINETGKSLIFVNGMVLRVCIIWTVWTVALMVQEGPFGYIWFENNTMFFLYLSSNFEGEYNDEYNKFWPPFKLRKM